MALAVLAVGVDSTVLSVALPTLAGNLHASESDLEWFSSGYLLTLAAAMLPAGLLGDRYGRKKVLLAGLGLFGAGSAACAYSSSAGEFLAARLLIGLAGAGVIVMAVTALTVLFSEQERPKAVGVWAAANFVALPVGPILGGWMLSRFWWGWVFLINVPVVALALAAVAGLVPESRSAARPGLDPAGMTASAAGLAAVSYGLIRAGQDGWGDAMALAFMIAGATLLGAFFAWERHLGPRRGGQPMLDLSLFESASFTWGVILAAVGILAMIGVLVTMPQYFEGVLGVNAMGSGLRLLPLIAGVVAGAIPADLAVRLAEAKVVVAAGFALLAVGLFLGSGTSATSGESPIAAWMAITGAGIGLVMATASSAAIVELTEERSGVGSAVFQAVNKMGSPFGTAILGSVLSAVYLAHLDLAHLPPAAAAAARQSIFGGVATARKLGSAALLSSARTAFHTGHGHRAQRVSSHRPGRADPDRDLPAEHQDARQDRAGHQPGRRDRISPLTSSASWHSG